MAAVADVLSTALPAGSYFAVALKDESYTNSGVAQSYCCCSPVAGIVQDSTCSSNHPDVISLPVPVEAVACLLVTDSDAAAVETTVKIVQRKGQG